MDATEGFPLLRGMVSHRNTLNNPPTPQNVMNSQNFHQMQLMLFPLDFHLSRWKSLTLLTLPTPIWHLWAYLSAPPKNAYPNILQEQKQIKCFWDNSFWFRNLKSFIGIIFNSSLGITRTQTGALRFYLWAVCASNASAMDRLFQRLVPYFSSIFSQVCLAPRLACPTYSPYPHIIKHIWKEYMSFILLVGTDISQLQWWCYENMVA